MSEEPAKNSVSGVRCLPTALPSQVQLGRFERLLVVVQRRVIRGSRDAEARRKLPVEQAGPFQFVEAGQIGQLFQPEM